MRSFKTVWYEKVQSIPCPKCKQPAGDVCADRHLSDLAPYHAERFEAAIRAFGEKLPPTSVYAGIEGKKQA